MIAAPLVIVNFERIKSDFQKFTVKPLSRGTLYESIIMMLMVIVIIIVDVVIVK